MEIPEDVVYNDDEANLSGEDMDPCPTITVTREEFEEWCSPWRNSLIINVLGKRISYRSLENKIQREWAKAGLVRMVDLSQEFYLVQFAAEEDYKHALFEGPWMIADHYIVVQRWRPFFTFTATQTRRIAAWIRIPGLPIELFNDRFLWRVGSKLGTMLKIDKLTSIQSRGRFARICVEIDLQKKLVSQINVLGHILRLEYEGLHSICFTCGKYGHKQQSCQDQVQFDPQVENTISTNPNMDVDDDANNIMPTKKIPELPGTHEPESVKIHEPPRMEDRYGPWMIVKKNKKPKNCGIWCLWNSTQWNLIVLEKSFQFIHFLVSGATQTWFLTVVYASPHSQIRVGLWRDLKRLAAAMGAPWCVIGDFNAMLHNHERKGGVSTWLRGDQDFRNFVNESNMVDMGFHGAPFTCKWLELGDRNTKYFHGTTLIRRRRNRVVTLQNDDGEWVTGKSNLEDLINNFYTQLFTDPGDYEQFCLSNSFPKLDAPDIDKLACPISNLDIQNTLQKMGSLKAPGPDGLHAIFYQSQWNIIGQTFCELIHAIEASPSKVAEINNTLITLIPKTENVSSLKQMHPISLCNVSYKIITKILSNRLRQVMADLVSPNQCSFVPHRQASENIIITQEVIHSMKRRTGNKGWMAIKIDLEKTYDRLNWRFIRDTLSDIGLPQNFVELVWACISTPSSRVLWNGEALQEFHPSRGIRQGDPLSPYLFMLCMERLFHIIEVAVAQKLWKPICLNKALLYLIWPLQMILSFSLRPLLIK
uniref:LINE-1 reverse transcriptase isogeny n=1 Tax=Cajanus cajan TaxID=3821 RepID=A0A151RA70_CAJCA|nr:LINE-1 reverse transcriptase isogeny [Cajanus cajan]